MKSVWALTRAHWRAALSYRVAMAFSVAGLVLSIVPVYFIAEALQPTMAPVIAGQGEDYFRFLVLGMVALHFVGAATTDIPLVARRSIRSGTLEAMIGTPVSLPTIFAGLSGYDFLRTAVRSLLFVSAAAVLGASLVPARIPLALVILLFIVIAHIPFGMLAVALLLAFRTMAGVPRIALGASALLGGAYYPTEVIPSWIEIPSYALPLTYGLRALRRVLLEGQGVGAVAGDVAILGALTLVLFLIGALALAGGLRYARRDGNLAIY